MAEVWFDGAGGKGHVYDWQSYYDLIRELQPKALIAICGPGIRWVGNEDGFAREDESSVQVRDGKEIRYPAPSIVAHTELRRPGRKRKAFREEIGLLTPFISL